VLAEPERRARAEPAVVHPARLVRVDRSAAAASDATRTQTAESSVSIRAITAARAHIAASASRSPARIRPSASRTQASGSSRADRTSIVSSFRTTSASTLAASGAAHVSLRRRTVAKPRTPTRSGCRASAPRALRSCAPTRVEPAPRARAWRGVRATRIARRRETAPSATPARAFAGACAIRTAAGPGSLAATPRPDAVSARTRATAKRSKTRTLACRGAAAAAGPRRATPSARSRARATFASEPLASLH